jgi:gas vesicle protein
MELSDALFAGAGIIAGAGSTLIAPWVTEKLTSRKQKEAQREAEDKRERDIKFDRLVLLRESTRSETLEASITVSFARSTRLQIIRPLRGTDSTYAQMARSLSSSYPEIGNRFFEYGRNWHALSAELSSLGSLNVRTAIIRTLHLDRDMNRVLDNLDELLDRLKESREALKEELQAAAEDLGYEFVISEEPLWDMRRRS